MTFNLKFIDYNNYEPKDCDKAYLCDIFDDLNCELFECPFRWLDSCPKTFLHWEMPEQATKAINELEESYKKGKILKIEDEVDNEMFLDALENVKKIVDEY